MIEKNDDQDKFLKKSAIGSEEDIRMSVHRHCR